MFPTGSRHRYIHNISYMDNGYIFEKCVSADCVFILLDDSFKLLFLVCKLQLFTFNTNMYIIIYINTLYHHNDKIG